MPGKKSHVAEFCFVELSYTLEGTENTDTPIMLVYGDIGIDEETGEGISGEKFTRELMFLDTLGKNKIEVWVNSGGGIVTDGEQIYHAILKSKTPVDTVNTGTAASIALPIFLAGRNRDMMAHAKNMMHPVSGGDKKSGEAFTSTVSSMLASRSFLSEDQVKKLMAKTSWIMADESKDMGLCTSIDYADKYNIKNVSQSLSYKEYSKTVNKLFNKKPMSNKVNNRLKLNEEANDDAKIEAINAIENRATAAEKALADFKVENSTKFEKAVKDAADILDKYNKLKADFDAKEEENKKKMEEECKNKSETLVKELVKLGKLTNKEEVIKAAVKSATDDYEGFKTFMEVQPVNKKGPDPIEAAAKGKGAEDQEVETTMNSYRAKHFAKYKESIKNRVR